MPNTAGADDLTPAKTLGEQRNLYDVPADVAYFNTSNLSPQLRSVQAAGRAGLETRGRPWAIEPRDWFSDVERLRALFGEMVGADAEATAIIPATSYGFAVAARNVALSAGQKILVLAESSTWLSDLVRLSGSLRSLPLRSISRSSGCCYVPGIWRSPEHPRTCFVQPVDC